MASGKTEMPPPTEASPGPQESKQEEVVMTEKSGTIDTAEPSLRSDDEPKVHLHAKTYMAVLAIGMIYFAQLTTLVGAGAQGQTIAGHFKAASQTVWLSAPITILTVVLGPIVSQAADYWGRRIFLISCSSFGVIGSIIVSRATSIDMVIAGFSVIGIAFGAQPLLHAVTSEVLPRRWRGYGQAWIMISNGLGTITGLLVGGALNRTNNPAAEGFRKYFLISMACYAFAVILTFVSYNPPDTPLQREYRGQTAAKLQKLDWIGYFLLASGLVLFSLGLSWSQNPYPWSDAHVSATFAVGLALTVCLIVYETWFKKDGMFHHGLFRGNTNFAIAVLCVFSEGVGFFAANNYFAFQVSVLYETDSLLVGTRYSMMLISSMVGATAAGLYCSKVRKVRWITVLAFLIFVAFFGAMASTDRTTNTETWGFVILLGIALGMTLTTLVTVAQLSTPPELISVASGLIIAVRSLGGTVGIAIYNALFVDQMGKMPANIAKAVLPEGLPMESLPDFIGALNAHNETALAHVNGVTPEIIGLGANALLDTFAHAFRNVWIAGSAFVALAAVIAAFLKDPEKEFNMRVDAPVEKEEDLYH